MVKKGKSGRTGNPGRGFTLVEMVISMSVGVILCGSASMLLLNASRIQSESSARGELTDCGSAALDMMMRYLREISQDECPGGASPCLNGSAQIDVASGTEVRFDGVGFRFNPGGNSVEMSQDDGASWHRLASDVSSFSIEYRDRVGSSLGTYPLSTSDRSAVRRVIVTVGMSRAGQSISVRTGVYLRSFMNEVASDPT